MEKCYEASCIRDFMNGLLLSKPSENPDFKCKCLLLKISPADHQGPVEEKNEIFEMTFSTYNNWYNEEWSYPIYITLIREMNVQIGDHAI